MSMSKELSKEEVGAFRSEQTAGNLVGNRGVVSAAYGSVPINGYVPESAAGLDARLVPLAETPQLAEGATAPTGAGEPEHDSLDGGAVDGAWATGTQDVAVEVGGAGRIGDFIRLSTLPYVTEPTSVYNQFFDGYREAGAPYSEERIDAMIWCESSWRIDPGGFFLGLAQFEPGTWATVSAITGYTDWLDPFSHGYNVSVWASMVDPGSRSGWPYCWWAW
jgi:hypothetical protein